MRYRVTITLFCCLSIGLSHNALGQQTKSADWAWLDRASISSLIGGIAGAILGTFLTAYVNQKQSKEKNALEMHKEINGEEMSKNRVAASRILAKTHPNHLMQVYIDNAEDELAPVWVITSFYERLYAAIKYRHIPASKKRVSILGRTITMSKRIAPDLSSPFFGELFCYYYYGFFENRLVYGSTKGWELGDILRNLAYELETRTDEKTWSRWKENAERDARDVIKKYNKVTDSPSEQGPIVNSSKGPFQVNTLFKFQFGFRLR